MPFDSFNVMFSIMPIFFGLVFILVFGTIIFTIARGVKTWSYNNSQPVLTVIAKLVTKRTDVTSHMHNGNDNGMHHHSTSTTYYVTFEVESGDRMEFNVGQQEYGMLVEEDIGKLKFQGSRYLGFNREKQPGRGYT